MQLIPLSPYHKIFYNEWKLDPSSCKYNIVFDQTVNNNLDVGQLKAALQRFVTDHLLFNCRVTLTDNQYYFISDSNLSSELQVFTCLNLSELSLFAIAPFNLDSGPFHRFGVFKQDNGWWRIVLVVHHIIMDGSGGDPFIEKVSNYYNDNGYRCEYSIDEQYELLSQHSHRLHSIVQQNNDVSLAFWQDTLNGLETIDCRFLNSANSPINNSNKQNLENKVAELRFSLNENESLLFKTTARKYKTTPYYLGQAIFAGLINYYTGCKKFAISYPMLIRDGIGLICGVRVNTSLIVYNINKSITIIDLIQNSREFNNKLKQSNVNYAYCPINNIVNSNNAELLNIGFADNNLRNKPFDFNGVKVLVINHDLSVDYLKRFIVDIETTSTTLNFRIKYDREVIDQEIVKNFSNNYQRLILHVLNDLQSGQVRPISEYDILSPEEYKYLTQELNHTFVPYSKNKALHQIFEEQVERASDAIALVYEDIQLSYQELNYRANQLAHHIIQNHNIKPNDIVALCLKRNEFILITILAVLKAGAAYVPIDPDYPVARIDYILKDTGAKLIITNHDFLKAINFHGKKQCLVIDRNIFDDLVSEQPKTNPNLDISGNYLAYIIYTSGTTGKPKGVMIEHKSVVNLAQSMNQNPNFLHQKVLWYSNYIFDAHVWEIYPTLSRGAMLFLLKEKTRYSISELDEYIQTNQIEMALIPPSLLTSDDILKLKVLFVGGESTAKKIISTYLQNGVSVINAYGPSEITVYATLFKFNICDSNNIIGKPIANVKCYVLNPELKVVPIGAIGELYIGGAGLAEGYLNLPELTASKFIQNPFQTTDAVLVNENARIYRTGDLVRYLPDGNIEYCGRIDNQVKIRGQRVELAEIEQIIGNYPEIKQAVALVNTRTINGDNNSPLELNPNIEVLAPDEKPSPGKVDLLPIQTWFFNQKFEEINHWNQAFLIRVPELDIEILRQAIKYLVNYHDCFRIYYRRDKNGEFSQYYASLNREPKISLHLLNLKYCQAPIEQKLTEWQSKFNLEEGDLFTFGYIDGYSDQSARVFCAIHHLIIDVVSWHIIQHDLEKIYNALVAGQTTNILPAKTSSYRQWGEVVKAFALSNTSERNYWQEIILSIPEFNQRMVSLTAGKDGKQAKHNELTITINQQVCNRLLQQSQRVSVSIHEILVTAVSYTLGRLLPSTSQTVCLTLEGHGREQIIPYVDLSRTIGWFTSMYPVKFCIADTLIDSLFIVKDLLKQIPYNGVNYGFLYGYEKLPVVSVNYLGLINQNIGDWEISLEDCGTTISHKNYDVNLFNLNSWIIDGELQINISSMFTAVRNQQFIQLLKEAIYTVVDELSELASINIEDSQHHTSKYIVGYYVADKEINKQGLRDYLAGQLPMYAVPHKLIQVPVLPITTNGKIDKTALLALDVTDVENQYIAPRTVAEQIICNAFRNILAEEKISINDDFFNLGGDSILAIKLVMQLQNHFKINMRDIFSLRTPNNLAQHLVYSENYIKSKLLSLLDNVTVRSKMIPSGVIPPLIHKGDLTKVTPNVMQSVLLTGATGYLGCNILNQLLRLTTYQVFIIVRAASLDEAVAKIEHKYQLYFKQTLVIECQKKRLTVLVGDLEQERFGLAIDEYNSLSKQVDSIIHSAALVKQIATEQEFYNANVLSTINLLKFSLNTNVKSFHYISTMSLLKYNEQAQQLHGNYYNEASKPQLLDVNNNNPYLRSKLQTELEIMKYRNLGANASIYRVGNLAFVANDCSTQENIHEVGFAGWIKYFFNSGFMFDYIDKVDISPVDWTAQAIVKLFDKTVSQNQIYHVFNPNTFSLKDFILNYPKYKINIISQHEFIASIITKLDAHLEDETLLRFMLIQGWLDIEGMEQFRHRQYSQDYTQELLSQFNFEWQQVSNQQFNQYLQHIIGAECEQ